MKKTAIFLLLLLVLTSCGKSKNIDEDPIKEDFKMATKPIEEYDINTYYLEVFLDTDTDVLTVKGEIIYYNDQMDFTELYLTLFPNAINPRTYELNNCVFQYLRVNGESVSFTLLGDDDSLLRLDLNEVLVKDENFSVEFQYSFQYWNEDRLMVRDGYYMTMFFYPYVTMYDDSIWQHVPYTFSGESYYNDIGDYYVSLNVPSEFTVVSSGKKLLEEEKDGRKTQYLFLENGRDFSFSACDYYFEYTRTMEDRDFTIVSIRELTENELNSSFNTLSSTFDYFDESIGEYYYDYFTLEYGYIYGMESSGIVYCSSTISEGTVVHEIIHQWFYSMIGNNQADDSFLDESLTTFVSGTYFLHMYGQGAADEYYSYRSSDNTRFEEIYDELLGVSLLREVHELMPYYGFLIYYHGVSIFKEYVDTYLDGDYDFFMDMMSQYYDEYNGKVVTVEEFLSALDEYSNVDGTYEWFTIQITQMQDLRAK